VVLGQFKRGKSSFINSIIGDKILPTSVVPLTSIVTMLKYGQQEEIEVIFEGGNRRVISQGKLPDYVTERGNPKNVKEVKQVEIAFPSAFLKDGLFIIDTPGVGSTFQNNTEMTHNYLPFTSAKPALLILALDVGLSSWVFHRESRRVNYLPSSFRRPDTAFRIPTILESRTRTTSPFQIL
jgi:ribosome biogenesis GTPase A